MIGSESGLRHQFGGFEKVATRWDKADSPAQNDFKKEEGR
jgi:hypothetical protein